MLDASSPLRDERRSPLHSLVAIWGIFGIVALVGQSLWKLTPIAVEPIADGMMTNFHWAMMIFWVVFNAYAEGYRGFHKRYSPRTVSRAFYLMNNPTPIRVLLAPVFCMGFFGATRKILITSWAILIMVVALVIGMKFLDQPWRGIIDAGVVVGLGWGLASILLIFAQCFRSGRMPTDPCVPDYTFEEPPSEGSNRL